MKSWRVIIVFAVFWPLLARAQAALDSQAVFNSYCVNCHNQRLKTAGLMLDTIDATHPAENPEIWEKVIRKLRAREMPPAGIARPDDATYVRTVSWLEGELDKAAVAHPNPGHVSVHRLNRTEYANAVRDLFGIEINARAILPGDVPDRQTFDNMASVLSVSPALLENYLSAAFTVSRLAVGDTKASPPVIYKVPLNLNQDQWMGEDLSFGSQRWIRRSPLFSQ